MEQQTDEKLEKLWEELGDVPVELDEDNYTVIDEDWHIFEKGTETEYIWSWFDEKHSKGVAYLMLGIDSNDKK